MTITTIRTANDNGFASSSTSQFWFVVFASNGSIKLLSNRRNICSDFLHFVHKFTLIFAIQIFHQNVISFIAPKILTNHWKNKVLNINLWLSQREDETMFLILSKRVKITLVAIQFFFCSLQIMTRPYPSIFHFFLVFQSLIDKLICYSIVSK